MKTVTKTAQVSKAYGETLDTPLDFSYDYEELQKGDEIPASEVPDDEDIRSLVNAKRNAKARAKAQNEALSNAGVQKPTLENEEFRLKQMVKILQASGMDEATATSTAKATLGL